jgi:hypothetical protein
LVGWKDEKEKRKEEQKIKSWEVEISGSWKDEKERR